MSDLKRRQFIDNEVKPAIRVELPKIMAQLDDLKARVDEIGGALKNRHAKPVIDKASKTAPAIAAKPKARPKKAKTSKK